MVAHQGQGQQHLARESTNQCRREACKAVRFDQLVQINAQKLHSNAEVISEIEMLRHFYDMMLLIWILRRHLITKACMLCCEKRTHFLRSSRILISTNAWWWNRFLFRMILIATDSPVQ